MRHIAKLKSVPCDVCKKRLPLVCVWFDGPNAKTEEEEYLAECKKNGFGPQGSLAGEMLSEKVLEKFPIFSGKYIGYKKHDAIDPKTRRKANCVMSGKAPEKDVVFEALALKIAEDAKRPTKKPPKDGDIAVKRKRERSDNWKNGLMGVVRKYDFFADVAKAGLRLLKSFEDGLPKTRKKPSQNT